MIREIDKSYKPYSRELIIAVCDLCNEAYEDEYCNIMSRRHTHRLKQDMCYNCAEEWLK
jgi:superfamily II helicase